MDALGVMTVIFALLKHSGEGVVSASLRITRMENEMVLTCMRWCHGTQVMRF